MVPGAWGEASRKMKVKVSELGTDQGLNPAFAALVAQSVGWGLVGDVKSQQDHMRYSAQAWYTARTSLYSL